MRNPRTTREPQLVHRSDRMALSQLVIALRGLGRDQEAAAAVEALRRVVLEEARPKANYQLIRITP